METRVRRLFQLRLQNKLREMLDLAADDVVFEVRGSWMAFPYTGPVKGKANVAKALMSLATQYENMGTTLHAVLVDGEQVALRRSSRIRHRGTNRVADVDLATFMRFRDGLIIFYAEVANTAVLARLDEF